MSENLRIWVVTVGELLPIDGRGVRLYRSGMLCDRLAEAGHQVTWWSSRFNHHNKQRRTEKAASLMIGDRQRLELLEGCSYRRNVSLARLVNHVQVGNDFAQRIRSCTPPHVILASFPTVELCAVATRYGRRRGVPVLLDVRDLWPDIFLDVVPRVTRIAARLALSPYFAMTRCSFRRSTGVLDNASGDWRTPGLKRAQRYGRLAVNGTNASGYPRRLHGGRSLGCQERRLLRCRNTRPQT